MLDSKRLPRAPEPHHDSLSCGPQARCAPGGRQLNQQPWPILSVTRLHPAAQLPRRANPTDAGLDLVAISDLHLVPGARGVASTGLAVALAPGFAGLVMPRSGLARRHGVTLANSPGLVDAGYRGELQVVLINLGDEPYEVHAGDRIAQLTVMPVEMCEPVEVGVLPEGDGREQGGFGSSGR